MEAHMESLGCKKLGVTKHLIEMKHSDQLTRLLLKKTQCIVRVYIIDGFDIAS